MIFTPLIFAGAYQAEPEINKDERGLFYRYYCEEEFKKIGFTKRWVQLNYSYTSRAGTIRGMHFQRPPYSEIKMVKCIAGKVFDVIIDIREKSPTFLQWQGIELSSENRKLIYIPEGFAHGFQTLSNDCELIYHHSAFYKTGYEDGISYNDPLVNIQWPMSITNISARDNAHQALESNFKGL